MIVGDVFDKELEGVVAHEMSHIKNYDVRFMMLVTLLIGALTRYPERLARALEKIKGDPDPLVDKATAHLFIGTPFRKKKFLCRKCSRHTY